jgi:alkanesulfonate monooxygenase SsuD/methylene tetrahydromethanopterin reductase-like flavin-dependent oxidoreductase (luciferase family)
LSINSHGFIAETSKQALDESFPAVSTVMNRIGRERGWAPMTRADYDAAATLRGANFVGTPEQVVEKILFQHEIFGHGRFLLQLSVGTMPHASILRAIRAARHGGRARRPRKSRDVGKASPGRRGEAGYFARSGAPRRDEAVQRA